MASPSDHHRQAGDPHAAFDDAEQGFAYIKPLWCLQAIIKPDGPVLGVNASADRVDIGQHLVRPLFWTRCIAVWPEKPTSGSERYQA